MHRLLAALLAAVLATPALAQVPRLIPYQGVLEDGGAPVTTATDLTFRLFDLRGGGTEQWAETQTVTPDASGVFAVQLGSVNALDDLSFGDPLWLEVLAVQENGGGLFLGPRTALGATPYALGLYGVRVMPPTTRVTAPSIVGGDASNEAGRAAVVAGGGGYSELFGVSGPNRAMGEFSFIGGGYGNTTGDFAVVGGGVGNTARGNGSVIGGGERNTTIYGLTFNYATIGGGFRNTAKGTYSTVPGGAFNHARGAFSFAAGINARAIHKGTFVWADPRGESDSLLSTGNNQFLIRAGGGVGIGTNRPNSQLTVAGGADISGSMGLGTDAPLAQLHVETQDLSLAAAATHSADLVVESTDAVIGLYSTSGGVGGSAVSLGEVTASGALTNKWAMMRGTGASGALHFTFGTSFDYGVNDTQMRIDTDGSVHADGSFTGGGADLAEYFPLAAGASIDPGQVVGLRGGRVSLATSRAEQVMVVSSDPAFVGNPDAEAGGALVALVGQVEVQITGAASVGDLLVASGRDDGTARAVAPEAYRPEADGPVAGRVLSLPAAGRAVALVGVDEAAALRAVVARQAAVLEAQATRLDAQQVQIDALVRRLDALSADALATPTSAE